MAKAKAQNEDAVDVDATIARLRTFVDTFNAMNSENERRAALYWLVASLYGNDVGANVLAEIAKP